MHTTKGPLGTVFIHNGDYSGAVVISSAEGHHYAAPFPVLAAAIAAHTGGPNTSVTVTVRPDGGSVIHRYAGPSIELSVPAGDLRALLGERIRDERISALEQAVAADLFDQATTAEVARWAAEPPDWE